MAITFKSSGSFKKTSAWLTGLTKGEMFRDMDRFGRQGVAALSAATPKESGATASSWYHKVFKKGGEYGIAWYNDSTSDGVNIAIILQYGHGTGTGGWVSGRDYINPAIQPVMDNIADELWRRMISG